MTRTIGFIFCFLLLANSTMAQDWAYTTAVDVRLRQGPGTETQVLDILEINRTLTRLGRSGEWVLVRDRSGVEGYAHQSLLSDVWIKVHKTERRLLLMQGDGVLAEYPVALSRANPLADKVRQGDHATPEGRFFVTESLRNPDETSYGARSMRLSYPSAKHARQGLVAGLIDRAAYASIIRDLAQGRTPSQSTALGGSIRIHGGGSSSDWTLGCIALEDEHIVELFDHVPERVRVEVYRSADQDRRINDPDYLPGLISQGIQTQLAASALYTDQAAGHIRMGYPGGDIMPDQAVCTDVVVRALRHAGLDLQALLHEDVLVHPGRYARWISRPDTSIDHRRTRNLNTWLTRHAQVLYTSDSGTSGGNQPKDYQLGDLLVMDTGIPNGTIYDHIGIVAQGRGGQGFPLVFNIWTTGMVTSNMDLLGYDFPTLVGHFRLLHLFDYGAAIKN